jgi:hypothetical protein
MLGFLVFLAWQLCLWQPSWGNFFSVSSVSSCGGFLKWGIPKTIGFNTEMVEFWVIWGAHILGNLFVNVHCTPETVLYREAKCVSIPFYTTPAWTRGHTSDPNGTEVTKHVLCLSDLRGKNGVGKHLRNSSKGVFGSYMVLQFDQNSTHPTIRKSKHPGSEP